MIRWASRKESVPRRCVILPGLLAVLGALPGCLWLSGTITGVVATQKNKSHDPTPSEPLLPDPDPVERRPGPFILLEGNPVAVAIGNFVVGEVDTTEDERPANDVAVIFEGGQHISFFEGDGEGRLKHHSSVPLRTRNSVAMAVVPPLPGEPQGLLVATSQVLELLVWSSTDKRIVVSSSLFFEGKADLVRDVITLDHDADGVLDVAVSSHANNWVEFFRLSPDRLRLERISSAILQLKNQPLSLTAADFFHDGRGQSDLAILAEEGARTIVLLHLSRPGGVWCETADDKAVFGEPGLGLARGGDYDVDGDGSSDIVASRSDGIVAVSVSPPVELAGCGLQSATKILTVRAGSRHFSPRPAGVAALHMPGGLLETWDRVTVDEQLNALVCSYYPLGGRRAAATVTYPLPGKGRALATGDLNSDDIEDLVAVTVDPVAPALSVLLAQSRKPVSFNVEKEKDPEYVWRPLVAPFYYPFGIAAGEPSSRRQPPRLGRLAHGWAGEGDSEPFLAVADRANEELAIFFLDPTPSDLLRGDQERYGGLINNPIGVNVGHFDDEPGDDILVGAEKTLHFLRNRGAGTETRFEVESIPFEELQAADPHVRDLDFGADFELQNAAKAFLDDNEFLDVAVAFRYSLADTFTEATCLEKPCLTVPCAFQRDGDDADKDGDTQEILRNPDGSMVRKEAKAPVDYVIVILNLGAPLGHPDHRKVRFYRVPNSPRDLEPVNLNGDVALDLIVACGGDEVEGTNVVYQLFGDPAKLGEFFDDASPDPKAIHPIALCGPDGDNEDKSKGETEGIADVSSNNSPVQAARSQSEATWPLVEWILSSNLGAVHVYQRTGSVPEPDGRLSPIFGRPLRVASGDDPEGIFVYDFFPDSEGRLDLAVDFEAETTGVLFLRNDGAVPGVNPWSESGDILPIGAPQHLEVIPSVTDALTVAVSGRTNQRVEILQQIDCPGPCSFTNITSIPLLRPNVPGHFSGFSVASRSKGGLALALRLEDGDLIGGTFPVDVGRFPRGDEVTRDRLLALEALDSKTFFQRVLIETTESPSAVCLGSFSGSGQEALDLLVAVDGGRTIRCHRGQTDPNIPPVSPGGTSVLRLDDPLLDWCAVEPSALLVATEERVELHQVQALSGTSQPLGKSAVLGPLLRVAKGWTSPRRELPRDFFVAALLSTLVRVVAPSGASVELLAGAEELGALGVVDVNGDGRDDLAVVEKGVSRLRIFLQSGPEGAIEFTSKTAVGYPGFAEPVDVIGLEANGDKYRDVAFGARTGEIFVFLGNGVGSFQRPAVIFAGAELEGLRAHDLDGDGLDEILAAVAHPGLVILPGR